MFLFLCEPWLGSVEAGLKEGVTDSGLRALVSAGCGVQLTSLTLRGECFLCDDCLWEER